MATVFVFIIMFDAAAAVVPQTLQIHIWYQWYDHDLSLSIVLT